MAIDWDALLAAGIDLVGEGHEGYLVTEAVARTGFTRDPAGLRAAYDANPDAIDAWADQLDTRAIVDALTDSGAVRGAAVDYARSMSYRSPVVVFGAGALAGFLLAKVLS